MKKTLLTALLGVFSFVGFTSATDYTFDSIDDTPGYNPSSFIISSDSVINSVVYDSENNPDNAFVICSSDEPMCSYDSEYAICYVDSYSSENTCINKSLSVGTYYVYNSSLDSISSITLSISSNDIGDSEESGTLLPNGTDDLTPILNGFKGTILEFIPYVSYLGLGIIVAVLGFIAIRRLVNWVRAKIFDSF